MVFSKIETWNLLKLFKNLKVSLENFRKCCQKTAAPNSSMYPVQFRSTAGPLSFMFLNKLIKSNSARFTPFCAADCSGDGLIRSLILKSPSGELHSGRRNSCPFGSITVGAPCSPSFGWTGRPATASSDTESQGFDSNFSWATTTLPCPNLLLLLLLMLRLSLSNLRHDSRNKLCFFFFWRLI